VRQLYPDYADDVDPVLVYAKRNRPAPPARPWLMVGMVAGIDGSTALEGVSGGLGGAPDRHVFRAVRAVPDVIVVGAGTVRAERYGPARLDPVLRRMRRGRGQTAVPAVAVVSGRLDLDPASPLFIDAEERTIVVTHAASDPGRRAKLAEVADVLVAGDTAVVPDAVLAALGARGATTVLCEGGPTLNNAFAAAGLVDEVCQTLAPTLAASRPGTFGSLPLAHPEPMRLTHVLESEGVLFVRYERPAAGHERER
jgi:riboflavin biosynthesis pyrimidine reductase